MNKRTESIRLKHLQDIYYEKLQGIAYDVYDEQLHNLVIRPEAWMPIYLIAERGINLKAVGYVTPARFLLPLRVAMGILS